MSEAENEVDVVGAQERLNSFAHSLGGMEAGTGFDIVAL